MKRLPLIAKELLPLPIEVATLLPGVLAGESNPALVAVAVVPLPIAKALFVTPDANAVVG